METTNSGSLLSVNIIHITNSNMDDTITIESIPDFIASNIQLYNESGHLALKMKNGNDTNQRTQNRNHNVRQNMY